MLIFLCPVVINLDFGCKGTLFSLHSNIICANTWYGVRISTQSGIRACLDFCYAASPAGGRMG